MIARRSVPAPANKSNTTMTRSGEKMRRDKRSADTFSVPGICRMSMSNMDIAAAHLLSLGESCEIFLSKINLVAL